MACGHNNGSIKPGEVRNTTGRPKGATIKQQVQNVFVAMLEEPVPQKGDKGDPQTFLHVYKKEFIKSALAGTWAAKIIAERLFHDNILDQIDKSLNREIREDEDFQTYRILKRAHDIQQRMIMSMSHRIYCMAGRRAGKTEANILKAIHTVASSERNVLIICLTQETAIKLYWQPILNILDELGHLVSASNKIEGLIQLENGSQISMKGNNTTTDREKFRGAHWDCVIIDEVQSQHALPYLINDIIEPTLLDTSGQLILTGTGPRVKGTYWEKLWTEDTKALRLNWNLSDNPFIPDFKRVLDKIKQDKGLTDDSPLFQREYLGLPVYDSDAMVWRLTDDNYFEDADFEAWISRQPVSDIRFTAGLDYGYADCDGFVIICYSASSPEKWIIYEYKENRTGITELYQAIKCGMDSVLQNPLFVRSRPVYMPVMPDAQPDIDKSMYIFCDTNEQKISQEFRNQYNLPTTNAYKYDKDLAIELLQEEVRRGNLKMKRGSMFEDECFKTVWKRNERDELTREIDHDEFHPDLADAVIYSLRFVWKYAETPLI